MTVPANDGRDSYVGNGITTSYAYGFAISDQGQILVMQDAIIMTVGTHYSVSGVGDTGGGSVTFFTPPNLGAAVTLLRRENNSQLSAYTINQPYNPLQHERDFDHLIRVTQMLAEEIYRSAKFPAYFPNTTPFLPRPETGKFLTWANSGSLVNVSGEPTEGGVFPDFDVIGDGVTDVTVSLQTAWNAAGLSKRTLYMPAGTYIVTALAIPSNLRVFGDGKAATVIKRANSSAGNIFVSGTNVTGFSFTDVGFDGNKSNQSNGAMDVELDGCGNIEFIRCAFNNAYGSSHGAGMFHKEGVDLANNTQSQIINCEFVNNERLGLVANKVSNLLVDSNIFYLNPLVGLLTLADYPPEISVIRNLRISKNICLANGNGIQISGFLETGSTPSVPIYGHSVPPAVGVVIEGNQCILNTLYGIAYQSYGGTITGNFCDKNGFGTGYAGGILATAVGTAITGNVVVDSEVYGIDTGWSLHCSIIGNTIIGTGQTSGLAVNCINMGRGGVCSGNNLFFNGTAAGGLHISATGFDLDGNNLSANVLGNYSIISNNVIEVGHGNVAGISIFRGHDNLLMEGNTVLGSLTPFIIQGGQGATMHLKEGFNVDWSTGVQPAVVAASVMVIPDVGDRFAITGTTGITEIRTFSSNAFFEKVRFIQITNNGSGYTSAPTVGFSGGGGSGAAGTARLSGDGLVIGVDMTNHGSGYTSAPTVAFTGGGGSGAAGSAILGCDNFHGRDIKLIFSDSVTVTDGSNLLMAGSLSAGAGTVLHLCGSGGFWVEVSRSIN